MEALGAGYFFEHLMSDSLPALQSYIAAACLAASQELRRQRNLLPHAISTAEQERQREGSNPSWQSPMDSESTP